MTVLFGYKQRRKEMMERWVDQMESPPVSAEANLSRGEAAPGFSPPSLLGSLPSGVEVALDDVWLDDPVRYENASEERGFWIEYMLSGCGVGAVEGLLPEAEIHQGDSYCWMVNGFSGYCDIPGNQRVCMLTVQIPWEYVASWGGDDLPEAVARCLEGNAQLCHRSKAAPQQSAIIQQMLHCPYAGSLRGMFLEGKVLELLSHRLGAISEDSARQAATPLSRFDLECINHARDIVLGNMENPPTIIELARMVGINETKLKKGFKQVFGTTVFNCLRSHRMELAQALLTRGDCNVAEAAVAVGYSNASHFTRAFRREFGVNPGDYLHQMRNHPGGLRV